MLPRLYHNMLACFLLLGTFLLSGLCNLITLQTTPSNTTINTLSSYTFSFFRKVNPVNGTIQNLSTLDVGSSIQITFPLSFPTMLSGNYPCTAQPTGTLTCMMNNNVLTVSGYYNASTLGNTENRFVVSNIKNPEASGSSGEFQYLILNSLGQTVDQSAPSTTVTLKKSAVVLTPATFASSSLATTGTTSTISIITVTLTPTNVIPQSGQITITLPSSWNNDPENAAVIPGSISCLPVLSVSTSIKCSLTSVNTILISNLSTSSMTSQFSFNVHGILLPPNTSPSDSVLIQSQLSNGNPIDTCSVVLTGVSTKTMQTINITNTITTVGIETNSTLTFILANSMTTSDTVVITFPVSAGLASGILGVAPFSFFNYIRDTSHNQITLGNFTFGNSFLSSGTIVTVSLLNLTNPLSTSTYSVSVGIYRNQLGVQTGTVSTSATPNNLSFSLTPSVNTTGRNSPCVLNVTTSTTLLSNSYLILQYPLWITPTTINLPSITVCKAGSTTLPACSYSLTSNYLNFTSLLSNTFTKGNILISFSQLTNPPTVQPATFTLSSFSFDGTVVDTGTYSLAVSPSIITTFSLESTNYTVLSQATLRLNFSTGNPFSMVSVIIPEDVSVGVSVNQTCIGTNMASCSYLNRNLSFTSTTQSSGSVALSWGGNVMPNSFQPTHSFLVFTYLNGSMVSTTTAYVGLTMNSTSSFVASGYSLSSNMNGDRSTLNITYTTLSAAPSGYLLVTVPQEATISLNPLCTINSVDTPCTSSQNQVIIAVSVSSVSQQILIQNITNPVTTASTSAPITISLLNSNNYSSVFSNLGSITNILPSLLSCSVTTNVGFFGQSVALGFSGTLVGSQSNITVTIPASFPAIVSSPCLICTLINSYSFSYPVTPSILSFSFTVNLNSPAFNSTSNSFSLTTYSSSGALVQQGSTLWLPKCSGTSCKDCSGTTCLSCYNSSITNYTLLSNGICISSCPAGYYVLASVCYLCDPSCKNCLNSSTNCTECYPNSYLNTVNSSCSSTCPDLYFPDSSTRKCLNCQPPCLTCTSLTSCLSCKTGYLSGTSCLVSCPTGTTVPNETTKVCDKCDPSCLTCQVHTFHCTSCNTTIPLYLQNNQCVPTCSTGLYPLNGMCTPCQPPCLVCYDSPTSCLTCDPTSSTPLFFNYKCISTANCSLGYYVNMANSSCNICPSVCSSCVSSNNCTSCVNSYYLYHGSCLQQCPSTTYLSNQTCYPCINNCSTCSSSTICLTCIPSTLYNQGSCVFPCPPTTYPNPPNCTACVNCLTCLNSTYCLSCPQSQYLYNGQCFTSCPNGTYPTNSTCSACPFQCSSCSSRLVCFSCTNGYSLENNTCVSTCSRGISYNGICYPCGLHCDICGPSACELCADNYNLYQGSCTDTCPQNTISVAKVCQPCSTVYTDCLTCNSTQCLSCITGALINGGCTACPPGQYAYSSQCISCPSQCSICQNSTFCTSCSPGHYLYNNFCTSSCPINTIPSGGTCIQCQPHCSKCNQATTKCSICDPSYFVYQGGCVGSCPSGYVVSSNQSNCVTSEEYYQEYAAQTKQVFFPFTIAAVLLLCVVLACKAKFLDFHFFTVAVAVMSIVELGSWILLLVTLVLSYKQGHKEASYGVVCLAVTLFFSTCLNIFNLVIYHRYLKKDNTFGKWLGKQTHYCSTASLLSLSSIVSFKLFRFTYSKFFNKSNFSLEMNSVNSLKPTNILSAMSLGLCSLPALTASGLAIYYSVSKDQEFWIGLDTLLVTGGEAILMLIDLYHPEDYFSKEHTTKVKHNVDEVASDMKIHLDGDSHRKDSQDFSLESREGNSQMEFIDEKARGDDNYDPKRMWVELDRRGYRMVRSTDGDVKYYNSLGFEVRMEAEKEELYDDQGYRRVRNPCSGLYLRYDRDGYRVVVEEGNKRYHKLGYEVRRNSETGKDELWNEDGYRVMLGDDDNVKVYDEEGHQVMKNNMGVYERILGSVDSETKSEIEVVEEQEQEEAFEEEDNENVVEKQNKELEKQEEEFMFYQDSHEGDNGINLLPRTLLEEPEHDKSIEEILELGDEESEHGEEEPLPQQPNGEELEEQDPSQPQPQLTQQLPQQSPQQIPEQPQPSQQPLTFLEPDQQSQQQRQPQPQPLSEGELLSQPQPQTQSPSQSQSQSQKELQPQPQLMPSPLPIQEELHNFLEFPPKSQPLSQDIIFHMPFQQQQLSYEQPPSVQDANLSEKTLNNSGIDLASAEFNQAMANSQISEDSLFRQEILTYNHNPIIFQRDISVIDLQASNNKHHSPTLEELAEQVVLVSKARQANKGNADIYQEKVETMYNDSDGMRSANTAEWEKNEEDTPPVYDPVRQSLVGDYYTIDSDNKHSESNSNLNYLDSDEVESEDVDNNIHTFGIKKPWIDNSIHKNRYKEELLFQNEFKKKRRGLSGAPNPLIEYAKGLAMSADPDRNQPAGRKNTSSNLKPKKK